MRCVRAFLSLLMAGCGAEVEIRVEEHVVDSTGQQEPRQVRQQEPVALRQLTDAQMDSAAGLVRYDSVFEISGPTLLTTFPLDGRTADASEHVGEALDQYAEGLRGASTRLRQAGVAIHANNNDSLKWRDSLGEHAVSAINEYAIVYLFVRPDGRVEILRDGIKSDTAILAAARKHFGIALEKPPS